MSPQAWRYWFEIGLFTLLGLAAIYGPLLPFSLSPGSVIVPDFLFLLACAWVVRQPDTAPFVLVAGLAFLADAMLNRPMGLWALIIILATEFLRGQRSALVDQVFLIEWLTFVIVLAVALLINIVALALALVPMPGSSAWLGLFLGGILGYPVICAVLHWGFRIRIHKPTERSNRLGRVA